MFNFSFCGNGAENLLLNPFRRNGTGHLSSPMSLFPVCNLFVVSTIAVYILDIMATNSCRVIPMSRSAERTTRSGTGSMCVCMIMERGHPGSFHFSCPPFVPVLAHPASKRKRLNFPSGMFERLNVFMA